MKNRWATAGAIALAGIVAFNTFMPVAFAADGDPSVTSNGATIDTTNIEQVREYFTVEDEFLDFGRVSELGRSYTKEISLQNFTSNDLVIDATVEKYTGVSDEFTKVADWAVFVGGISHFTVAKGQTRPVNVRVAVPEDAKSGSQYATVKLVDSNNHAQLITLKIDVAGDNLKYGSDVEDSWIDPVHLGEEINARVTVKNTGSAGFTSTYQLKYKNLFGGSDFQVLKEVEEEVFPGGKVQFTANDNLGFGVFSVEQRVTFVNSEGRIIESELSRTVVNLPWWALAIAGGVILLIIIIIICAKRRGKGKKGKSDKEKIKRAERKERKAEIEKVEQAEEEAILEEKAAQRKEVAETDEIEEIAEQLEDAEAGPVDDDSEYEEEEATPIKINVRKG